MTKWVRLTADGTTIDAIYWEEPEGEDGFIAAGDDVLADWRLVDGAFVPPPAPPLPVPTSITDRQFALEARNRGFVSQAEALAFVRTGEIPSTLATIIAELPQAAQDDAEITISGAATFERSHPLTLFIGDALKGDADRDDFLDDFFRAAGAR